MLATRPCASAVMYDLSLIDVFTERAGAGNALAVVFDADDLDSAAMQRFATWINLSETTFVLPPTQAGADYRVRIFTPGRELPFAGHPSVGTAWALLRAGRLQTRNGVLLQECAAGLLPLRASGEGDAMRVAVRAPRARLRAAETREDALLDAAVSPDLRAAPGTAWHSDNGPIWWLIELRDEAAVRLFVPDLPRIADACVGTGAVGIAVFALAASEPGIALVLRAFCPADGIPEDPVTGSANAAVGALLQHEGRIDRIGRRYRASQGRELGRNGIVEVEADDEGEVWIGGACVAAAIGQLRW